MRRRQFGKTLALAGGSLSLQGLFAYSDKESVSQEHSFKLKYAPHLGMFKNLAGEDPIDQLNFMAEMGFRAFEDNELKMREPALQKRMADVLIRRNMEMGVFVAHKIYWDKPNLASGDVALRKEFLTDIEASVEVAKRVNAKWMTVVPGHCDLRLNMAYQTANVVESLKQATAILEPHGLVLVLEPLNFRDHPGLFLTQSPQAFEICRAVDSPACKILFDIYHQQVQEGNLIPNIDACWEEIAYFQIGDNPGRNEPGTGEINYKNMFRHISNKGYTGLLGMEHGNSLSGPEGEEAIIDAYELVDSF